MAIDTYLYSQVLKYRAKQLHNPVFIVGCGHSGTSILLRVIGTHSSFHAVEGESRLFYKTSREMSRTIQSWLEILRKNNKKRIIEKTPEHIYRLGDMFKTLHGVKVICMVRDGRDVACSHKQRNTFDIGLESWVKSTSAIKPYLNHPDVMIVRLEDFVSGPARSLEAIMEFLGEKYESAMLEYHKIPAYHYSPEIIKPGSAEDGVNHRALRNWQINQPLFQSTSRWRLEMTGEEKYLFKQKAQSSLVSWAYEKNDEW